MILLTLYENNACVRIIIDATITAKNGVFCKKLLIFNTDIGRAYLNITPKLEQALCNKLTPYDTAFHIISYIEV